MKRNQNETYDIGTYDILLQLAQGMNARFPEGNEPYQIMTRLLEECGEVVKEVHRFEKSGTKVIRHGAGSKEDLAGEVKDALNALMQLVLYYGIEAEVLQTVKDSIIRLQEEGYLEGEK